jgi:hypothetical protein
MENDLEKLRAELSLLTLAEQAGADLRLQYGEWRGPCPIHGGDNKSAFVIYEKRGRLRWHCFTGDCNERGGGGDEFSFLVAMTGKPFAEIVKDLREKKAPIPQSPREPTVEELARRVEKVERELVETRRRLDEIERWKERQPWQQYHDNAPEWAAESWRQAGVYDSWQSFWRLGGTDNFTYSCDGVRYESPSLTIPVFDEHFQCSTVRHRILQTHDKNDKYRPDMVGLGSHPFLGDPDLGFSAGRTVIVEGEKKAMVVFQTLDLAGVQVIGLPGKGIWREVAEKIKGQNPVILLDPDAKQQAVQMALDVGGAKVVEFGRKIDDTITAHSLGRQWLIGLFKTARLIK